MPNHDSQRLINLWIESNGLIYALGEYYEVAGWELGINEVWRLGCKHG